MSFNYLTYSSYMLLTLIQLAIFVISLTRPALADFLSLILIIALPTAFAIHWRAIRFLFLLIAYVVYLVMTVFVVIKVKSWKEVYQLGAVRRMDGNAPKKVYAHFILAHQCAVGTSVIGFLIVVGSLIYIVRHDPSRARKFGITNEELVKFQNEAQYGVNMLMSGLSLFFEGAYFGVLHRDFAKLIHILISATVQQPQSSKMGHCALCGTQLAIGHDTQQVEETLEMGRRRGDGDNTTTALAANTIGKLKCGHEFHATCLMGWSVVGKRDISPCCSERLDTTALFQDSTWQRTSTTWIDLTEQARFVVFYLSPLLGALWITDILKSHR